MPSNSKPWDRGKKARRQKRSLRRILILCEDEKSSVLYLKRFPVDSDVVHVECEGTGRNTDSLMEEAIRRKNQAIREGQPYQQVWVVFDRDDFPLANFNRVFDMASPHQELTVCWSNECFELWYLLHFQFQNTAMERNRIFAEVGKHLGWKYDKSDGSIYNALEPRLETAMKNAARLYQVNVGGTRRENPSTAVHRLVRMLLKLKPDEL